MAKTRTRSTARNTARAWFDQFDPVNPAGWNEQGGWCRRHFTPVARITDQAQRGIAERCASLELTVCFAYELRKAAPMPVPGRELAGLIRKLSPVCCLLGDDTMQAIVLAAWLAAGYDAG